MDWCSTKSNGSQLDPYELYCGMVCQLRYIYVMLLLCSYSQNHSVIKLINPFFNSCEWGVDKPWEWMYQYANSWRTGPDHDDDWTSTAPI